MNYLAAMLLLALGRDEEDAFWVLASLIDDNDEGARGGRWRCRGAVRHGSGGGTTALARSAALRSGCLGTPACTPHSACSCTACGTTPAGILYRDMYARDLTGTHVEMRCLRELVQHKLPRLAAHMDALACDMSILATGGCVCVCV